MSFIDVLIVEDSEMYFKVMQKILEDSMRYNLHTSKTVREAKSIFSEKKIDLILLDINLEDGNGLEVVKYVRNENKNRDSYILAVTSETSEDIILKLYKMGIDYYIKKPFNPVLLRATIERIRERISPTDFE